MKDKKDRISQIRNLMIFGAFLILILIYSKYVFKGIGLAFSIIKPFAIGGVIAFIINIPMNGIEKRMLKKWRGKAADTLKRPASMILALLFLTLILTAVVLVVVPQLTVTFAELGKKIPVFINNMWEKLLDFSRQYPQLQQELARIDIKEFNWENILAAVFAFLKNGVGSIMTSTIGVASSIIGGIVNGVISFIFALYILTQKERLADQGTRVIEAYASEPVAERILYVFRMLNKNFTNFVTGQCLEAIVLGVLFFAAMSVLGMPYALLIGVLIAFTALIPVVGAFIGCGVGAFLILIDDPMQALWFVIMFLVIQQLEGNLIYPKVVGNSVGLPAIWILMAVSVGGSLFGVAGMLFFIPLLSTCYALLRDDVNKRNAARRRVTPPAKDEECEEIKEELPETDDSDVEKEEDVPVPATENHG